MEEEHGTWTRQSEAFQRAHHEAWKRSNLNQRQYCKVTLMIRDSKEHVARRQRVHECLASCEALE
jgi:hypothetical protein